MPRIGTHGILLPQIAILCVSISFLTRNFDRDIDVISKILEWQFLLQIVVTECKSKQYLHHLVSSTRANQCQLSFEVHVRICCHIDLRVDRAFSTK